MASYINKKNNKYYSIITNFPPKEWKYIKTWSSSNQILYISVYTRLCKVSVWNLCFAKATMTVFFVDHVNTFSLHWQEDWTFLILGWIRLQILGARAEIPSILYNAVITFLIIRKLF